MSEFLRKNIFTLVLALVNVGFVSDYMGWVKFSKELSVTDKNELLIELKNDRDEYRRLYRDCNTKFNKLYSDFALLQSSIQLIDAINTDLPFAMWLKDKTGKVIYFNQKYTDLYLTPRGFSASDYLFKNDTAVWSKSVANEFRRNDMKAMSMSEPLITMEKIEIFGEVKNLIVAKFQRKVGKSVVGVGGISFYADQIELTK